MFEGRLIFVDVDALELERPTAKAFDCPSCTASAGDPCRAPVQAGYYHESRHQLADRAAWAQLLGR